MCQEEAVVCLFGAGNKGGVGGCCSDSITLPGDLAHLGVDSTSASATKLASITQLATTDRS